MQFRGPGLYKENGALFQEELYLPDIFMPSRKFAIKIQCEWDEKYVNLKMKTWRFSAGKILLEIVPPFAYKARVP